MVIIMATATAPARFEGVDTRNLEGFAVSIWDKNTGDMLAYRVQPTEADARALGMAILFELVDDPNLNPWAVGFEVLPNPTW